MNVKDYFTRGTDESLVATAWGIISGAPCVDADLGVPIEAREADAPPLHEARLWRIHQQGRRNTAPSHTQKVFDPALMPAFVKWAEEHVRALNADAIVACGHSGLPLAGAVSYLTGVPLFAVRKPGEAPVYSLADGVTAVAPNGAAKRWVWLDDFISSGGTFRNAVDRLWDRDLIVNPWPVALLEYGVRPEWLSKGDDSLRLDDYRTEITQAKYPEADWANAPKHLTEIGCPRP